MIIGLQTDIDGDQVTFELLDDGKMKISIVDCSHPNKDLWESRTAHVTAMEWQKFKDFLLKMGWL